MYYMAWDLIQLLSFLFLLTLFPLGCTLPLMRRTPSPSLPMFINFYQKFGLKGLLDLQEMLDNGTSQREICGHFSVGLDRPMDEAQMSRYVNHFFKRRKYVWFDELKTYMLREADRIQPPLRLVTKDQDWPEEGSL